MTGFFHVPSAFGVLEEKVIPALFDDRPSDEPIRVWVAGCATGEEAYSVAILLFEYASTLDVTPAIEIYATDNDQDALNTAQKGVYSGSIVEEMSSVCLGKYFIPNGDGFSVIDDIKAAVHFSSHDVLIDNSFQSFELITCRHLLAYLDQASQSQIVTFFHHSLRPGGFLFLGDAEFAESLPEQFESIDSIFKIYQLGGEIESFHIDLLDEDGDDDEDDTLPTISETTPVAPAMSAEMGDGMLVEPIRDAPAQDGIDENNSAIQNEAAQDDAKQGNNAPQENSDTPEQLIIDNLLPEQPAFSEGAVTPDQNASDEIEELARGFVQEIVEEHLIQEHAAQAAEDSFAPEFEPLPEMQPLVVENPLPFISPEPAEGDIPDVSAEEVSDIVQSMTESPTADEMSIEADFLEEELAKDDGKSFNGISVDPPFDEEHLFELAPEIVARPPDATNTPAAGGSNEIISQLHRSVMLQDYAPASLLIDRSFGILDYTGRIDRVFDIEHRDLTKDYLDKLPDFYRLNLEEALNQIFHEKSKGSVPAINLPALPGKKDVLLEIQFMSSPDPSLEIVHVLFKEHKVAKKRQDGVDDTTSFFASPATAPVQSNGVFGAVAAKGTFEENFIRSIKTAPFPVLLHVEGGNIIELSQPWVEMAGVTKEDAPTISAWTKKAKGQRLKLKDSKLKESYRDRGVVCISIRTKTADTKLLAFHSSYLGIDSKGRKLTLTMAVDITNYPGHSGMGITPEVADFGVAAKKTFLANMSHEVRTPLTSMIGFADYLSDKLTGQDVQFARYISESGNRLLETLNAVLRISSMDGIEQVMRYEMLDITVEAQGILQLFKPHAEQYGIPLKLVVEQPAKAKLDRASLRRILSNVLGNAIKFTPEGEVTITVNSDVNSVIVEIEDTGVGISEEFLPFVFDRFAQESKGQGRSHSGCGLGLSICKHLVETMGGTIQVETEAGVGSKFAVRLPIEPSPKAQPSNIITSGPADNDDQGDRPQI
ncbi:MAG: CheR family methyltransferase, partial [Rhodothermales bacterium]